MVLCADGLSGIKKSIAVAYPQTEYQCCIVHQVRNTLKYVADKDKKAFVADLRTIYHAPSEVAGYEHMEKVTEKWQERYLNAIESLKRSVFPSDMALLKSLYLSTFEAVKKWTMLLRNWVKVYGELSIMYEGRMPE